MGRRKLIISAILLSSSLLIAGTAVYASTQKYASTEKQDNTIVKGVFIDEVEVGGMTKEQAEAAIDQYEEKLCSKSAAIMVGDEVVYTTMGDMGYKIEENDAIEQALSLGKTGNLIKRYKDIKDIEQGSKVYPLTYTYDKAKITDLVAVDVSAYNVAPVNATVSKKNGEFVYTNHKVGSKVNVDETVAKITSAIDNWNKQDLLVEAVVEEDAPKYTKEDVEQCKDLLGTFTTDYSTSSNDRAGNVANGARLINNTVLYPGDTFSAYKVLSPFTKENGYFIAGAYLQGKVIDSVGGGSCQVTTTLYNAVLQAELEVVERQSHSMVISYADPSRDAAIAGTSKNFQFKNDSKAPILIEGITSGRKITFKIWGKETRDTKNRKVEYVSVVKSETAPPPDVVTKDPTQPTTYMKVTQAAHVGYKAELYKVVYENGVETSRTLVNKSSYQAAPKYVTVGTKKVDDKKTDDKKVDEKDKAKDKAKDDKQPTKPTTQETDTDVKPTPETKPDNLANPDGQVQADTYDDSWFEDSNEGQ